MTISMLDARTALLVVEGLSSSTVNVIWGFFNLAVGYLLVCHVGDVDLRDFDNAIVFGLGVLLFGLVTARLFGRFHGGNSPVQGRVVI